MLASGLRIQDDYLIAGIGEILWDEYPDRRYPGGAPANVAYHSAILGDKGIVLSRVGMDDPGIEIAQFMYDHKVDISYLQKDTVHPTGKVTVSIQDGEPVYEIHDRVAWDYLELTEEWVTLARSVNAVCFGTLAQRHIKSKSTIQQFLAKVSSQCLKVLDFNLRTPFYSEEIIRESIAQANIVKMNRSEQQVLTEMLDVYDLEEWLFYEQGIQLICLTKGKDGSELITPERHIRFHNELPEDSGEDPVGAGDAFTATLIHYLLRKSSYEMTLKAASRYAGRVAAKKGAMPDMKRL